MPRKPRTLRVIRKSYDRKSYESYQLLQERRWWGWKTIDREEVPTHHAIAIACYGMDYPGAWTSKFAKYGHFSRRTKGIIERFPVVEGNSNDPVV